MFGEDTVYIISTIDTQGTYEPGLHASKPKVSKDEQPKRELNISLENRSFWNINIFSKYIDEKDGFLSVFDVIWINFSEQDVIKLFNLFD